MNYDELYYLIEKPIKKATDYESAKEHQVLRYNDAIRELRAETKSSENDYDRLLSIINK